MPNTEDNFWNDEKVIEFMDYFKNDFSKGFPKLKAMEYFKNSNQSKQPVLDYEILKCTDALGIHNYVNKKDDTRISNCDVAGCKIHSVKRLSDNEVFTIDEITGGNNKILEFVILNSNLIVKMSTFGFTNNSYFDTNIQSLTKKPKQPFLFTTEDNVKIHEDYDGIIYRVFLTNTSFDSWKVYDLGMPQYPNKDEKYFVSKEAANEYVLMNKPCLSLNEVMSCSVHKEVYPDNPHFLKLKELAKQKINGV